MGWNKPSGEVSLPSKKPSAMRGVVAGVACVGIAVVVAFFVLSGKDAKPKAKIEKAAGLIKEAKPAAAPKAEQADSTAQKPAEQVKKAVEKAVSSGYPKTNADGSVLKQLPNGKTYLVRPRRNTKEWKKKYPFENPVLSQLSWYAIPGLEVPPMLPMNFSNQDVAQALIDKVEIGEDDDEDTQNIKESVRELKEQLKSWVKDGGAAEDFIKQLARRQAMEYETVRDTRNMVMEAIQKGDLGLAKDLQSKLNDHLKGKGLPAIRLPRKHREMLENYKEK